MKGHAATKEHINNAMAHRTFGRTRIDEALDHAHEIARKNHNAQVKRNREGMTTLIDLTCFLGSHGLSFRGHNEQHDSVNKGNYKDLCEFIASRDVAFADFVNNNSVFSGTSASIQNELIEVIGSFMIEEIFREVQNAEFISVMVDETTDVARKSQLATTFRYCLKDGTPVERFVDLCDASNDKTAVALAREVVSLLEKFSVTPEKLVAQTYDGAHVMSGVAGGTQAIVKKLYRDADYILCKAHVLNLVLLHACNYQDTRKFLTTLSTLASFFTQSPKRDSELKNYIQRKIPNVCKVKWAYTSRMVNIVEAHYSELTTCLGEMYLGNIKWDGETCSLARGLHSFMLEFDTIFYLKVFSAVFSFTDILYQTLQTKELDYIECGKSVRNTHENISNLQTDKKYKAIWQECLEITGETSDGNRYDQYFKKYNAVITRIISEFDQRFADLI
ncbi:uncharacterized protein LOC129733805 [Wyeomyia smithii]|uniref:uncharacterized protein LOC129733805 n=1 Tax=Wyeomyia smithii TaxID=174621 RepID=UPI002467C292|nr:uncharacterized protein LOC129733805 [Wyeomyia smithii]